jgi:hypothetical protein
VLKAALGQCEALRFTAALLPKGVFGTQLNLNG